MCIVPGYLTEEIVKAYPDAKFILTERDPDAWLRSLQGSVAGLAKAVNHPPLSILKQFDEYNNEFCKLVPLVFDALSDGKGPTEEGFTAARQHYIEQ